MFPAEVLPIVSVLANLVHFLFGLIILVVFLVYYKAPLQLSELAWFPVVVLVQLLLSLGLALILSAMTVHFRDIKDILANVLTLWFFATPIIYPISDINAATSGTPAWAKTLINLNPFTHLAVSYQEILFYNGPFGHWKWLLALGVASVLLFLFGYFLFDRLRDSFAEEV
jgi:ABC-type polysaccharide/polyol phosphate export permease